MHSPFETLVKILQIEQSSGYPNRSIMGGIAAYGLKWAQNARTGANPDQRILIDQTVQLLVDYGSLSPEQRREAVEQILRLILPSIPYSNGNGSHFNGSGVNGSGSNGRNGSAFSSTILNGSSNGARTESRPDLKPNSESNTIVRRQTQTVLTVDESPRTDPGGKRDSRVIPVFPAAVTERLKHEVEREQANPLDQDPVRERIPLLTPRKQEALRTMRTHHRRHSVRDQRLIAETERALASAVTTVDGVGPKIAEKLEALNLRTLRDVFYNFPRRYDDYTQMMPLGKLEPGMIATAVGEIVAVNKYKGRRGQDILNVTIADGTGKISATFFGAPWLISKFEMGTQIVFSGKVDLFLGKLTMSQPEWEAVEKEALHTRAIVPVYRLTKGVTAHMVRKIAYNALNRWTVHFPDPLPETTLDRVGLDDLGWAIRQIHFPESQNTLEQARRRLIFDELLTLQLAMLQRRRTWQSQPGTPIPISNSQLDAFWESLPFPPTGAQRRAVQAIREDMSSGIPMNRLLQGDVGSGKTIVAAATLAMAALNERQAALMAPTSILAEQHFKGVSRLLHNIPDGEWLNVRLLTGSTPRAERDVILNELAAGNVHVLIGTHAIFQPDVKFRDLGVVVIDEQHRFGVGQRGALRQKGTNPHVLVMTATPIPRTLALTAHADLDLTILDEMPPGRSPIKTKMLDARDHSRAYTFIDAQVQKGRQAFIVYPLVEASEAEAMREVKSAVEDFGRLQKEVFPHYKLGLLHGKMSPAEKEAAMAKFSRNETQVLICTAVVEVGIDVPNATVILIEGANRFGLAQLHQFRGRVGRGQHPSSCMLMPDDNDPENARLRAMESTTDGFALAEMDLQQRGAGDLLGEAQSGGDALDRFAGKVEIRFVEEAQIEAKTIFAEDPLLEKPEHVRLRRKVVEQYGLDQAVEADVS